MFYILFKQENKLEWFHGLLKRLLFKKIPQKPQHTELIDRFQRQVSFTSRIFVTNKIVW
jgi:hypothetical protein